MLMKYALVDISCVGSLMVRIKLQSLSSPSTARAANARVIEKGEAFSLVAGIKKSLQKATRRRREQNGLYMYNLSMLCA